MRAALAQALFTEPDILLLVRPCLPACVWVSFWNSLEILLLVKPAE